MTVGRHLGDMLTSQEWVSESRRVVVSRSGVLPPKGFRKTMFIFLCRSDFNHEEFRSESP